VALRRRAPSLDCPRILTTGISMFPAGGVPIYVRKALGMPWRMGCRSRRRARRRRSSSRRASDWAPGDEVFVGTWLGGSKTD
jgi:hypothetical protein